MKTFAFKTDLLTGEEYYEVQLRGQQLLYNPLLNKASAFTEDERRNLGLDGFLRDQVSDIEKQRTRSYEMFRRKQDEIEKYIFLQSLLNRNETLFYSLLCEHLPEMLPIVYTPTVGKACQMLSHITRDYRGIYISPDNIAHIDRIFEEVGLPEVSLVVVTDGERILGLGDLGSDGMGIPVGKINLYVAAGGLHPAACLPISLDVGTNNERLLNDPLYLGYQKPRLTGDAYFDFVEKFVSGVKRNFPNALLQWEDFAKHKAFKLLDRYRERILSFNDDIQGTGAVALSALLTGMRIKKQKFRDQNYVIVGMGQAGTGIASNILTVLREEGVPEEEARSRIFAYDTGGLLVEGMPGLDEPQLPFVQKRAALANWHFEKPGQISLLDVVRNSKASVLIGVTATPGLFGSAILTEMAKNHERPMVFALSNPTSKCECTPEDVARVTRGRGLVATGSPFPSVECEGRVVCPAQCNNMFIFPGVGLGTLVSGATQVTSGMFLAASKAVSAMVTEEQLGEGRLLPELQNIREVSATVAIAVAKQARDSGIGRRVSDEELEKLVRRAQWKPRYYPYRRMPRTRY